jgi:phenylpropionate dioxygenase-like ring-hydroxylating dioxygenase large terminal subunit
MSTSIRHDIGRTSITGTIPRTAAITRERYVSPEFMKLELEHVWPRVWNIGGRSAEIPEPGDYVTHQLADDSILMVRQQDGSIRAFFNVCPHRGNRLVQQRSGSVERFTCSYHGWQFSHDGETVHVQDEDDFPQGSPCGNLTLTEIQCADYAGFIWYNMDWSSPPLADWLGEIRAYFDQQDLAAMTRTFHRVTEVDFNWKCLHDNFCESYHLPTAHPQLSWYYDDDYRNTDFELFGSGHSLMKMKGAMPSLRDADPGRVNPQIEADLLAWGLDPKAFEGRAREARAALQARRRELGPARGYRHFARVEDGWLTDAFHFNIFPGTSITITPMGMSLQRAEPHPTDPNKAIYEHWHHTLKPDEDGMVASPIGRVPFRPAEREAFRYGEKSMGFTADQDLQVATGQQLGFRSRGFKGAYLAGQEERIQQFHNCIDAHIAEGLERARTG